MVAPKVDGVYPGEEQKGFDVGREGIQEIGADARALSFIEGLPRDQVVSGGFEDLDPHGLLRISSLALSQGMERSCPSLSRFSRASSTSRCHAGEGTLEGVRARSSQTRSRTRSLSSTLILS